MFIQETNIPYSHTAGHGKQTHLWERRTGARWADCRPAVPTRTARSPTWFGTTTALSLSRGAQRGSQLHGGRSRHRTPPMITSHRSLSAGPGTPAGRASGGAAHLPVSTPKIGQILCRRANKRTDNSLVLAKNSIHFVLASEILSNVSVEICISGFFLHKIGPT